MEDREPKVDPFKIDRSAFSVISLDEQDEDEKRYWHSKRRRNVWPLWN
ncbi:MAG: hypothetical protein ACR2GR_11310 [Rhodothermales bacterium]